MLQIVISNTIDSHICLIKIKHFIIWFTNFFHQGRLSNSSVLEGHLVGESVVEGAIQSTQNGWPYNRDS
jgi:hypothetical protein